MQESVREGDSRFDFLLDGSPRGRLWIEVKSVTLVENGVDLSLVRVVEVLEAPPDLQPAVVVVLSTNTEDDTDGEFT